MNPEVGAVLQLAREAVRALAAYEHAHWDPRFERLHANESPWPPVVAGGAVDNQWYPEPQPRALVAAFAEFLGVDPACVLLGRGSDEGIDLLTRCFCEAGEDSVLICPPTFGMYRVAAEIQGAKFIEVPLRSDFSLDTPAVLATLEPDGGKAPPKILWLCSPNNPTGNALDTQALRSILAQARGRALVVIDEAYAEFHTHSFAAELAAYPHLVLLRTLSKAHALAGARIGAVLAAPAIIALLRKVIPPYAIPRASAEAALAALTPAALAVTRQRVTAIVSERERLAAALRDVAVVRKVHASDANFLLVEFKSATDALERLQTVGLLVRNFRGKSKLGEVLRITVGTPEQNLRLIATLMELQ
jgi:histidinol-phosphate aminotransferase